MSGDDQHNRQPRNLQDLLKFSIGQVQENAEVSSTAHQLLPMDDERRKWLDEMLASMSVNVAEVMRTCVVELMKPEDQEEESLEKKETALETLLEWVDNLDFANDFHKIGGFVILRPCLESAHSGIRYRTAEVIAELVQNNPYCQTAAMESDLMGKLLQLVDTDENDTVRVKAQYALSALLRSNPDALKEFEEKDGFSVLLRAMESSVGKLKLKAAFLLNVLCAQHPRIKDTLCNMGYVEQFIALLQREHDDSHEYVMEALCCLVGDHASGIEECQRPELMLQQTLNERIEFLKGKEEFRNELDHCKRLMQICFAEADKAEEDR